jgi:lipoprotein-anchoring transpeptidase ErfK/SrfK
VVLLVAGIGLTACVGSNERGDITVRAVTPLAPRVEHIARSVHFARAAPAPALAVEEAAPNAGPVTRTGGVRSVSTGNGRVVAAPETSVWDRFDGELAGASHVVARVLGEAIAVSPHRDEAPAATLSNRSPSGAPRVFLVVGDAGDWLQVLLPLRPNSSVGWIRRSDVDVTASAYRVEIDRGAHRIQVFDGEQMMVDDAVAVGKPSTPTPAGQFFTTELLQPSNPGGAYGPYAFTLSAYSDVFQTFGSGDGAVGIHGTNEQSSIGRDASHGCVRLHNDTVRFLATFLPLGTPVFIR